MLLFFYLVIMLVASSLTMRWIDWRERRRFPELKLVGPQRGAQIWLRARQCSARDFWFGVLLVLSFLLVCTLAEELQPGLFAPYVRGKFARIPLWTAAAVLASFCAGALTKRRLARGVRIGVIAAATPVCVECGYQTHALSESRCPECGTEFQTGLCPECCAAGRIPAAGRMWFFLFIFAASAFAGLIFVGRQWLGWSITSRWLAGGAVVACAGLALGVLYLVQTHGPACGACRGTGRLEAARAPADARPPSGADAP